MMLLALLAAKWSEDADFLSALESVSEKVEELFASIDEQISSLAEKYQNMHGSLLKQ